MAKEFSKLNSINNKFKNIYINWFPLCMWENLNNMIWFREPVEFEQDWIDFARHSDNHNFKLNKNIKLEMINWKEKCKKCKKCKFYNECEWVWSSYIWIYWWEEFNPIK
jgi:hypothetical protein